MAERDDRVASLLGELTALLREEARALAARDLSTRGEINELKVIVAGRAELVDKSLASHHGQLGAAIADISSRLAMLEHQEGIEQMLHSMPRDLAEAIVPRLAPEILAQLVPRSRLDAARQISYEVERGKRAPAGGVPEPVAAESTPNGIRITRRGVRVSWGALGRAAGAAWRWVRWPAAAAAGELLHRAYDLARLAGH